MRIFPSSDIVLTEKKGRKAAKKSEREHPSRKRAKYVIRLNLK